jgi:hypothetical protein
LHRHQSQSGMFKCKAWGYTGWAARACDEVRNVE